jgi:predicted enzyme related to lactoylglutathione lyase
MTPGFQEIVISVFNIDQFAEAFVMVGGYSLRRLNDAAPDHYAAWHVPPDCARIEQALLMPENDPKGFVRLVTFHGCSQRVMRSSQRSWDTGGIFDLDLYAADARASYAALQRLGWTAFGEPLDYRFGDFHVCEVLAVGPSGINIAIIQAFSPPMVTLPKFTRWSRAFNSAQIVSDYERAMDFYRHGLGWGCLLDIRIEGAEEPNYSVLGVPKPYAAQTPQNISILHPEGTNDGSIELIRLNGLEGRDFAAHCVAPNVGFLCYRFPVENLDAYAEAVQSRGVALYAGPSDMTIEPYGKARSFSARSPDGAIIEFFELSAALA